MYIALFLHTLAFAILLLKCNYLFYKWKQNICSENLKNPRQRLVWMDLARAKQVRVRTGVAQLYKFSLVLKQRYESIWKHLESEWKSLLEKIWMKDFGRIWFCPESLVWFVMFDNFCLDLVGLVLSEFVWLLLFRLSQTEKKITDWNIELLRN